MHSLFTRRTIVPNFLQIRFEMTGCYRVKDIFGERRRRPNTNNKNNQMSSDMGRVPLPGQKIFLVNKCE